MKSIAIISSQAFSLINFRGALISALVEKKAVVYALAPDYTDELKRQVIDLGAIPVSIHMNRTGVNPFRDLLDMFKLTRLLRELRPDVAFGYFVKPVIYGTLAAWIARTPHRVAMIEGLGYVFTEASTNLPFKRKLLRSAVSLLYRIALAKTHRVIFLNKDDITDFLRADLVDECKVDLVDGIGVDLSAWVVAPPARSPLTFLLVARLLREKGIVEYVEAARLIKVHYQEARFILLGGLDQNPGALALSEVRAWVDEGLIEWPGHVVVKPWLEQSSVFVLPSYREGLPRSSQEAMAAGRPVITTDAPGCRDTVTEGVNGYLVPVRDVPALVVAMERFIRNPDLIESMGRESRRIAESRFDVRQINVRLLHILGFE
jgi:glycosyltransferase involved in cell wall biosynthesis